MGWAFFLFSMVNYPPVSITKSARWTSPVPTDLTLALGIVLVGWQTAAGTLPTEVQMAVFVGLLAGAGVPHGALDHLIDRETAVRQRKPFSLVGFLTKYLLTVVVYGLLWLWAPVFCLALFLLGSAWHFGETDIERVPPAPVWTLTRFVAGGFVLAFLLLTHVAEVTPVLERITRQDFLAMHVWQVFSTHAVLVLLCWGLLTGGLFGWALQTCYVPVNGVRLARLGLLLVLCSWLPLLPAFGLYFGGWHALISFSAIGTYLRQTGSPVRVIWQIWSKSLPFTGLAVLGLALFGWLCRQYAPGWDPLPLVFIFLSLITLPHLSVIHDMNSRLH